MKVLHVYRTYYPDTQGGLEEVIRQICLNTQPLGVQSRVFTPSDNPSPDMLSRSEADVVQVKKTFEVASCGFALGSFRQFSEQVSWADVVHYHFPWPFADMLHFTSGHDKPSVITYHSDIVRQRFLLSLYCPLMDRFLARMDRIVATSPNYAATSEVLQWHADKVEIIPIGLNDANDLSQADGDEDLRQAREKYGTDFFFFVGVLRYYKGLHVLLDAARGAEYKVVIAGKGPEQEALKKQAAELGLDNVIFAGFISDREKMALFKLCRAVVFPSCYRSEAFGVTLLEGAMHSRPLISTEIGSGTSYVNIDGETGMVIAPNDATALRKAMDDLYMDEQLAREFGERARRRYDEVFTGRTMGAAYDALYKDVLGRRTAAEAG